VFPNRSLQKVATALIGPVEAPPVGVPAAVVPVILRPASARHPPATFRRHLHRARVHPREVRRGDKGLVQKGPFARYGDCCMVCGRPGHWLRGCGDFDDAVPNRNGSCTHQTILLYATVAHARWWVCVDVCVRVCVCVCVRVSVCVRVVVKFLFLHHRLELGEPNRASNAWAEQVKAVLTAVGEPSRASPQADVRCGVTLTGGVHNRKRAADVATLEEPEVGTAPPRQAKRRCTAPARDIGSAVQTARDDVIDLTQD
jgi:hypothetical protein